MSKEQVRMMNDADKLIKEAGNPLTNLFRRILRELEIEPQRWNQRLTTFLKSPFSRVPKNAKDIGQERNNFNRAIAKRNITFKTFQKAIQIMPCVKYSMTLTMTMADGREVTATVDVFNEWSKMDSLVAAVSGKDVTSENDITDYDDEESDEEEITEDIVDDAIGKIPNYNFGNNRHNKRDRRDKLISNIAKQTQIKE